MINVFDVVKVRNLWSEYMEGVEDQYPWEDRFLDEIADVYGQLQHEASKGRSGQPTLMDAIEIVADAQ